MALEPTQRVQPAPASLPVPAVSPGAPAEVAPTLPGLPQRTVVADNPGLALPAPAAPTLKDVQRLMRERAGTGTGAEPGTPQWFEQERQRLQGERSRGDDARSLRQEQENERLRRDLERRRLERR